jgi:hypothetical protein
MQNENASYQFTQLIALLSLTSGDDVNVIFPEHASLLMNAACVAGRYAVFQAFCQPEPGMFGFAPAPSFGALAVLLT